MATEKELRAKVVDTARSYLSAKQGSVKHHIIIDEFNKIKPDGWAMTYTAYWCAAFASAIAILAFGVDKAKKYFPLSANCVTIINKAKKMGIFVENDSFKPQPGDWLLYDWQDSGKGDNTGSPDHVGIVEKIVGKNIVVIEGNFHQAVGERNVPINGKYIRGFVTPKYSAMATKTKKKTVDQIAQEVIDGKWGTGDDRKKKLTDAGYDYAAVQAKVNEMLKAKTKKPKPVKKATKKSANKAMVDLAAKQIGNGYRKYCKAFGRATSWCQIFIWWLFDTKKMKYIKDSFARKAARWCQKHWPRVSMKDAQAGDVVFFTSKKGKGGDKSDLKWRDVTHVGMIRKKSAEIPDKDHKGKKKLVCYTIEGNVKKNKDQKGDWRVHVVGKRTRNKSYVWAVFRPPYDK